MPLASNQSCLSTRIQFDGCLRLIISASQPPRHQHGCADVLRSVHPTLSHSIQTAASDPDRKRGLRARRPFLAAHPIFKIPCVAADGGLNIHHRQTFRRRLFSSGGGTEPGWCRTLLRSHHNSSLSGNNPCSSPLACLARLSRPAIRSPAAFPVDSILLRYKRHVDSTSFYSMCHSVLLDVRDLQPLPAPRYRLAASPPPE